MGKLNLSILLTFLMKSIIKMQGQVIYRIISNTKPIQESHLSSSNEFHRSIPLKLTHQKQEGSSLAYLSSLMQTENLLMKNFPSCGHTTREGNVFITQKASSLPQTGKKQQTERQYTKKSHWIDLLSQTRKRLVKKENALLNIIGEYDPGQHRKKQNKSMQRTIYKARTYTMIPITNNISEQKKRQKHLKIKEEFKSFIKKQDWKAEVERVKFKNKIQTESIITQWTKTDKISQKTVPNTNNFYKLLKAENPRMKRLKTQQPIHHIPQMSKKMTQMLLKSELKISSQPFKLTKVGKRKSFKLKTNI